MKHVQPDVLEIRDGLRLRRVRGDHAFALPWYQDPETVFMMDGDDGTYDLIRLEWMYCFLDRVGELYFIEVLPKNSSSFVPIGDVSMCEEDFTILIGDPSYRGKGIGREVITRMIERARELGYANVKIREIFTWNKASISCFESLGFIPKKRTEHGHSYVLKL